MIKPLLRTTYHFARHLAHDINNGVGSAHFINDGWRFVRKTIPSHYPISYPPHSLHLYEQLLHSLSDDPRIAFMSLPEYVTGVPRNPQKITLMLRHDVDAIPDAARDLCAIERSLDMRSSVHILVDGALYDPAPLTDLASELHADGFDVGLHTQCWMHEDYASIFYAELERFRDLFGFEPRTFTQHGAWPRTERDMQRRREFEIRTPDLIKGTSIVGYNNYFDWVSEDSCINAQPAPIHLSFFDLAERCYLGGTALILTHDNHWQASGKAAEPATANTAGCEVQLKHS